MATGSLTSVIHDAVMSILSQIVDSTVKLREDGLSRDQIVDALTNQKLSSTPNSRKRGESVSRKTPRSSTRAPPAASSRAPRGSGSKNVTFDVYHADYSDKVVCTFTPLRGKNENTICCAEIDTPDTSDRAQFRCKTHKDNGFEASVQRYRKLVAPKSGSVPKDSKERDEPEVNDKHRPGPSTVRRATGIPKSLTRTSRATDRVGEDLDSYNGLTSSKESEPREPRVPMPTKLASRLSGLTSKALEKSEDAKENDDSPKTETRPLRNMTRLTRDVPKEDPASKKDIKIDESRSPKRSASDERPKPRTTRVSSPVREQTPPRVETPQREETPLREETPMREETPHKQESPKNSQDSDPEDSKKNVNVSDGTDADVEIEIYTVKNVPHTEWLKLSETRFIGVDTETKKVIGIYPAAIVDGDRLSYSWKSKLITDYTEDDLAIIQQLDLEIS